MISYTALFVLQWAIAAVGVIGNIWVIIAIVRYNAIKKTANKILFINLAIADTGVLVVRNPFFFLHHYFNHQWRIGKFTCKFVMPISLVFMPASLLTLVAISYSRCRTIADVMLLRELSIRKTWYIVGLIWAFVIILYPVIEIPVRRVNETAKTCYMDIPKTFSYVLYGFEDFYFVLSLVTITVMFKRMRRSLLSFSRVYNVEVVKRLTKNRNALKLLWPVVIVLFVTMIPMVITQSLVWTTDKKNIPKFVLDIIDVLLVTNSAINPFIYVIVSTEFRRRILQVPCLRYFRNVRFKTKQRTVTEDILFPYQTNDINKPKI